MQCIGRGCPDWTTFVEVSIGRGRPDFLRGWCQWKGIQRPFNLPHATRSGVNIAVDHADWGRPNINLIVNLIYKKNYIWLNAIQCVQACNALVEVAQIVILVEVSIRQPNVNLNLQTNLHLVKCYSKRSDSTHINEQWHFLSDPGKPGVRSLGPDVRLPNFEPIQVGPSVCQICN